MFEAPSSYDPKVVKKKWKEETPEVMQKFRSRFAEVEPFDSAGIEQAFKTLLEENEYGMGRVMPNLRLLITGKGMGPSLFDTAEILGKQEVLERMDQGLARLS